MAARMAMIATTLSIRSGERAENALAVMESHLECKIGLSRQERSTASLDEAA
jgi:hypothetical protein